jgi:hypothetical protein
MILGEAVFSSVDVKILQGPLFSLVCLFKLSFTAIYGHDIWPWYTMAGNGINSWKERSRHEM